MFATVAPPADYNVKLYLVTACVYAALQADGQALPLASGRLPGTPKAAVVAGAAGGVAYSPRQAAGVDMTPAAAGVAG